MISSLINILKSIVTQISYIEVTIDEDNQVAILHNALPNSYSNLVVVVKEKEQIPYLESIIISIKEEKKKLGIKNKVATNGVYVMDTSKRKCFECGQTNHLVKDCYTKNPCTHCGGTNHPLAKCYFKEKESNVPKCNTSSKNKEKG